MTVGKEVEQMERTLDRLLVWVQAADAKGTIALAIATAMLGVLASACPEAERWSGATGGEAAFCGIVASLAAVGLLGSGLCVCLSTIPRTTGPRGSLVFFGGIVEVERAMFHKAVLARSEDNYLEDLCNQCHRNAEIASEKFKYVRLATVLLMASIIPWLLALFAMYRLGVR